MKACSFAAVFFGVVTSLLCGLTAGAEPVHGEKKIDAVPAGYIITDLDVASEKEAEEDVPVGFCLRGDNRIELVPGMAVYAGDAIESSEGQTVGVVFADGSVATLRPASRMKVAEYAFPAKRVPTRVVMEKGNAFFAVEHRPADAHFFVGTPLGNVEVKGTKFGVYTMRDGVSWKTTVAVTDGTVSVVPNGSGGLNLIDVTQGNKLVLSVPNTTLNPDQGIPPVDINEGNLTKQEIAVFQETAAVRAEVKTDAKGGVKITAFVQNADGSTTVVKIKEVNGVRVSTSTVTKGIDGKIVSKVKQGYQKQAVTVVDADGKVFKVKVKETSGSAKIKDPTTGKSYKTDSKDPTAFKVNPDGSVNFRAVSKDGSWIERSTAVDGNGTKTETTIIVDDPTTGTGTRKVVVHNPDGSGTTVTSNVTFTQQPDGSYVYTTVPGSEVTVNVPPNPAQPPTYRTPTTPIVPEPPPVSQ